MASFLLLLLFLSTGVSSVSARFRLFDLRASNLPSDLLGVADGYVTIFLNSSDLGKTSVRHNTANPWWDEEFFAYSAQEADVLRLEVHDEDLLFDDLLGVCVRSLKIGTHSHDCYLEEGGTLHYTYSLDQ